MTKCVLIVEDNLDNQMLMDSFIKRLGYETACVGDAINAIEAFTKLNPALVLLDLALRGEHNGFDVIRYLRQELTSATPVIAVTAAVLDYSQEAAFAAGCDAYVTKPINLRQLSTIITEMIGADHA